MYSHADRIRAVELYIKLDKRVKATIRQLGYPTKNALRNWYREYQQHRDLRVESVGLSRSRDVDGTGSRGVSGGKVFDGRSILASGLSRGREARRGP